MAAKYMQMTNYCKLSTAICSVNTVSYADNHTQILIHLL